MLPNSQDSWPAEGALVEMDKISQESRSRNMSRIRSKDTTPELKVRSLLHSMGFRFRLHRRDLPGKPDIVLPRHRKIVLVHGCYWHGHDCKIAGRSKSNVDYWRPKIDGNRERDKRNGDALRSAGWDVLVVWECETRGTGAAIKLSRFLK